ncbi:sulfur globule protein CV3 domain protein [Dictyocaulus viviparus]|uniref:Sulfur globule protein CV3 domain protein n=1 Tax=Dictyocaulus viviparus TaxID=29172 RepID=A0A0D8XWH9_DICVI|nr:sulfur globule protein CV3 domain protein [Dictyocaulus viviparus]
MELHFDVDYLIELCTIFFLMKLLWFLAVVYVTFAQLYPPPFFGFGGNSPYFNRRYYPYSFYNPYSPYGLYGPYGSHFNYPNTRNSNRNYPRHGHGPDETCDCSIEAK